MIAARRFPARGSTRSIGQRMQAAIFLDHRRASIDVHDADGGFAATCLCGAWTGPFRRGQTGRTETRTDHERRVAEVVGQAFTHAVEAAR